MRNAKLLLNLAVVLSLLLGLSGSALAQSDYKPPTDKPGPAVDKLFFKGTRRQSRLGPRFSCGL